VSAESTATPAHATTSHSTTTVSTARGIEVEVRHWGSGPDVVWFHSMAGLAHTEAALETLGAQFRVHAPLWPGYSDLDTEGSIEDMLDFALLGWDIVDALGLDRPHLVGHSFGAMIAAEMACVARRDLDHLVLVTPFGLWLDDVPIPDIFAVLPFELAELLLSDTANAAKLLTPGRDMSTDEGLGQFMVQNARRLGTAGKVMFPIPNRRLSKRLYRLTAPTRIVMAAADALVTEPYGPAWQGYISQAELVTIADAGHLVNLDQPEALATAVAEVLQG
jgi:pimeloyl-ACP methyl ester carboxylesterase